MHQEVGGQHSTGPQEILSRESVPGEGGTVHGHPVYGRHAQTLHTIEEDSEQFSFQGNV